MARALSLTLSADGHRNQPRSRPAQHAVDSIVHLIDRKLTYWRAATIHSSGKYRERQALQEKSRVKQIAERKHSRRSWTASATKPRRHVRLNRG